MLLADSGQPALPSLPTISYPILLDTAPNTQEGRHTQTFCLLEHLPDRRRLSKTLEAVGAGLGRLGIGKGLLGSDGKRTDRNLCACLGAQEPVTPAWSRGRQTASPACLPVGPGGRRGGWAGAAASPGHTGEFQRMTMRLEKNFLPPKVVVEDISACPNSKAGTAFQPCPFKLCWNRRTMPAALPPKTVSLLPEKTYYPRQGQAGQKAGHGEACLEGRRGQWPACLLPLGDTSIIRRPLWRRISLPAFPPMGLPGGEVLLFGKRGGQRLTVLPLQLVLPPSQPWRTLPACCDLTPASPPARKGLLPSATPPSLPAGHLNPQPCPLLPALYVTLLPYH